MCIACSSTLDASRQEAFAQRFLGMVNNGMTVLMVSHGHRLGLFDEMADGRSLTSAELAEALNLDERYVREWLGAMTASQIVERDAEANTYRLPPEHASSLSRTRPESNMANFAQFLPQLGQVEESFINAFRNGGGVPYSEYKRFHEIMAEDSGQSIVPIIADHVVTLFDGLRDSLEQGIDVLDVGCGRGLALMELAATFPRSRFVGYDFSEEALAFARETSAQRGLTNLRFEVKNLTNWNEPESFDWIMALDAIHDQARPDNVLAAIRRALRPGGRFLMQDIDASSEPADNITHPLGATLYTISAMHCMTVSLAQGGMGLGAVWGVQKAESMLREAGFEKFRIQRFDHDIQNAYFVIEK